jgi:hypothetical protein
LLTDKVKLLNCLSLPFTENTRVFSAFSTASLPVPFLNDFKGIEKVLVWGVLVMEKRARSSHD